MIDRREILALAQTFGLQPQVVEKDYVLGWLLAGIRTNEALARHWVFKGGTCLKKCYFETYRFSEDLDFTVTDEAHLDDAFLKSAFTEVVAWIYEQCGIEIPADRLRFDVFRNKRDRLAAEGRIYYRGPIAPAGGDIPRIKLDLTTDELVVLPPVERAVIHPYSDAPDSGIAATCYAYEEVFGEKVRALGERARPRDLYDVINLFRHEEFQPEPGSILDVLRQKCAFKAIEVPTFVTIEAFFEELAGDWNAMLAHQLPALPPLQSFWEALPAFFSWLAGGARPEMPNAYPMGRGEKVYRPASGAIGGLGAFASALEIIRFAAANRLVVELDYVAEDGARSTRAIEAYSLRRTQVGEVVLHANRVDNGQHRSYRIDRIRGARATERTFLPRYAIELTPTGHQSIPDTERSSFGTTRNHLSKTIRSRSSRSGFGVTYVYQCPYCEKTFKRQTQDSRLRSHKTKDGWDCPGRTGYLIDMR